MNAERRRDLVAHLGETPLARLRRASGDAPLAELTVLASALAWALGRLQGRSEPVRISVPFGPSRGGAPSPWVTFAMDPDPARSLRAHTESVQRALVQALRTARPTPAASAVEVSLDTVVAHGEPPLPEAGLRLRYLGSGRLWLDTAERAGSDWPRAVADAMSRFLEALEAPDRGLGEISLLSPDDLAWIARHEDGRDAPDLLGRSLVPTFERRAIEQPSRPLVIGAGRDFTYGDLNHDASRLAHHLRTAHGVQRGVVVGVLLEDGVELVTCLLAVLEAGGVYLPMDVNWPEARVEEVIAAANASVLLTSSAHLVSAAAAIPTLAVDLQISGLAPQDANPEGAIDPSEAAYLLFTSGSTGNPKGVRVSHASLFNMLQDQVDLLRISPDDRVLLPFSPAFDASLLSIGLALVAGGAVVPLPRALLGDAQAAAAHIRDTGVTIASFVPSMLRAFAPEDLGGVRTIICGGEALTPADVARYGSGRRLVNSYGATETTCCVCAGDLEPGADITLGRPVANSSVRVLDDDGERLPRGAIGEICADGAAVALGYLAPGEGFAPSHFRPGSALYRTGDLGFFRDDGRIQLVGRRDRQVKIHGQRIEPGEIEAALMEIPGVRAAHVLVERGQLWAFVAGDELPLPGALLASLAARLPRHLVPTRAALLGSLLTGATGKVDEAALRALASEQPAARAFEEAETAWERRVVEVWREVLGVDEVAATSELFELGGNSLLALQILARIESAFGVRVALASFFQSPTVRGLAALAEAAPPSPAAPMPDAPVRDLLDLSPTQLGAWLDVERRPDGAAYNVPRAFAIEGAIDAEILRLAVDDLGRRHEALRTSFVTEGGQPKQRIHPDPTARLIVEDVSPTDGLDARIDAIASAPFRLDLDPLLRVALLLHEGGATLVIVAHHLVCDGWSMALLLRELSALYAARAASAPPPPAPSIAHRSAVAWQIAEAASPRIREQLAEWSEHLAGASRRASLSAERRRAPGQAPLDDMVSRRYPRARLDRLQRFAAARRSSPFQVLVAALACALREGSEEPRVVVGSPVSLRTRPEVEDQLGLFLNMDPLVVDTRGADTFLDVLARAEAEVAWALERRECPHALVAGAAGQTKLFDVEIDYRAATLRADPASFTLGSATARREARRVARGRKFDVDLLFTEDDDGLSLEAPFDARINARSSVDRLVDRMATLIDDVLAGGNPAVAPPQSHAVIALESRRQRLRRTLGGAPWQNLPTIREIPRGASTATFLAEERARLDDLAGSGGAVLYRGGDLGSASAFRAALDALHETPLRYTERSSARREVGALVYTSTEHPADQDIKLHTEHSYAARWPLRLAFCCVHPANRGGETPLASIPAMMKCLRPETLERFRAEGVLYVRNLGAGLGLDWPFVFGTENRDEVEAYCQANDIEWRWWGEGRLTLRFQRPALRSHPITGQELWFNHAYFFHPASLDPAVGAALRRHCESADRPFQTFYGSGAEIPDEVIREIGAAYSAVASASAWQRGDLLLVDNMMVAHGRRPFEGRRVVLVAMTRLHPAGGGEIAL